MSQRNCIMLVGILLLFLCNSQSAGCGGSGCPSYTQCEKYTHYALALQDWCNNGNWSIHGLWPDYSASCWPQYCHSPKWTPVSGQLYQQMMAYWNWCDGSASQQQSSWEHEWMRHGTCTEYYNTSVTQNDFFNTGLKVYLKNLNDGTVRQKCGTPKPNGSCETLCLDLNYNVITCPNHNDFHSKNRHKH